MANQWIEKNEIKEYLKSSLTDFFKQHGYGYKPNINGLPGFLKKASYGFNMVAFSIRSSGSTDFWRMTQRHDEVEKIIEQIGLPDRAYLTKYEFTCYDSFSALIGRSDFKSESELAEFAEDVKQYMISSGIPFADKYSRLENILEKINELESTGTPYNQFLGAGNEYFYRILIVSKMCNDPDYDNKCEKVLNALSQSEKLKQWIPGFEKLKTILG
jgi:hypothetical protein